MPRTGEEEPGSPACGRVSAAPEAGAWEGVREEEDRQGSRPGRRAPSADQFLGGRQEWEPSNRKTHGGQLRGCGREKGKSTLRGRSNPVAGGRRP